MNSITKIDAGCRELKESAARIFIALFGAAAMAACFFAAPVSADGSLSPDEAREIFREGTGYFQEAAAISDTDPAAARDLYAKAGLRFRHLVEEGNIENGRLYYNIANIRFLLDDIGGAILNYRRAERYIADDPNLAKNLAYARSMRRDSFAQQDRQKILQTLFFFHYDLGTGTRQVLFGMAYLAFWAFAAIKVFSRRPYTSWGLGTAVLFVLLFGGSLFVEARRQSSHVEGVILAPEVVARRGDAESYQPSFADPLHAGTEFVRLEDRGPWWRIELPDGRTAWIPAGSAELVRQGFK